MTGVVRAILNMNVKVKVKLQILSRLLMVFFQEKESVAVN